MDKLRQIGRRIRAAETQGATRYVTGVTTAEPATGSITVDLGDQVIPATVPGNLAGDLTAGQDVRLSVQGALYTVDSILSTLPASTVDGEFGSVLGFIDAGYSNTGFTDQDWQLARYAEVYLRARIEELGDLVNQLRQVIIDMGRAS